MAGVEYLINGDEGPPIEMLLEIFDGVFEILEQAVNENWVNYNMYLYIRKIFVSLQKTAKSQPVIILQYLDF